MTGTSSHEPNQDNSWVPLPYSLRIKSFYLYPLSLSLSLTYNKKRKRKRKKEYLVKEKIAYLGKFLGVSP